MLNRNAFQSMHHAKASVILKSFQAYMYNDKYIYSVFPKLQSVADIMKLCQSQQQIRFQIDSRSYF